MELATLQKAMEIAVEEGLIPTTCTAIEVLKKQNALQKVIEESIKLENIMNRR